MPLIEFTDMDRDGMFDMSFYHNGKIFTYYNKHTPKLIKENILNDQQKLCLL